MTPDEDAKANRQGSFLLLFSAKRTGVLSIWTDKLPKIGQICENVKEKKNGLQNVRVLSTSVLEWRLFEIERSKNESKS